MMTQEEFMDVMAMKRQGLTIKEIAEETGYHPSTISGWLKNGGPPAKRTSADPPVIDERWSARIAELVRPAPRLLATSVFELIKAEGYGGSYVSVARHLNDLRGPRFTASPAASTRIVTAPGEECQFDWSDVVPWTREWGLGRDPVLLGDPVLVPGADLVVRPLHRPGVHLRGPGPVLRALSAACPRSCAPTGWGPSASPRAVASPSIRRQPSSPSSTAPRSGPARPGTPSGKARWSDPSGT